MASYGYGGHILMLPEEGEEKREYYDEGYPFSVPKVILDGFVEQYLPPKDVYSRSVDSVVTVRGSAVTKFKKTEFAEQLVEDENGNTVWFDSRKVPFNGEWQCKPLGEWREAEEYTVEEIDLEKNVKKTYKVTLQETAPLDEGDIAIAQSYINIRKKNRVGDFVLDDGELVGYKGVGAEVVLPDGITSIGNGAFEGGESITSVIVPDGVTRIGASAFRGCASLQSITLPNSVTHIDSVAFGYCTSLQSITLPSCVKVIGNNVFDGCTALQSITIPDGVISIESGLFLNCTALHNITIPDSVKYISGMAFAGCKALKSIAIPNGVQYIGNAFCDCTGLKSITIPASVTRIDGCMFSGATDVEEIIIDDKNSKYFVEGDCIIEKWTNVLVSGSNRGVIPDGVMRIEKFAFYGCKDLKCIEIPDSVKSIGMRAFLGCVSLANVVIPDSITVIDDRVFADCTSLMRITIPNSVTKIEHCAFSGCSSLTEIIFQGTNAQWNDIKKDNNWDCNTGKYVVICTNNDELPF